MRFNFLRFSFGNMTAVVGFMTYTVVVIYMFFVEFTFTDDDG
jgi:hypothetical protein